MNIVFISNYYNHHQKELSDELYALTGGKYFFVETQPIENERLNMGWGKDKKPKYVKQYYVSDSAATECQRLIEEADIVIMGSAPEKLLRGCQKNGKLIFRYSERKHKKGFNFWKYPIRWVRWRHFNPSYARMYLLCAGAYTAADFARYTLFKNKSYKWGYFPPVRMYDDVELLISQKKPMSIVWVARLIEWKHPEACIDVAKKLKEAGYAFELNMIGTGVLEQELKQKIKFADLEDCVHLLGSMSPEQVREHMENSEVFLFTSDRNEGWGAVLNEAMNSACAVVAGHAIGSVPFLINNGKNGLIYQTGNTDDLYTQTKWLLDHSEERKEMGRNAYDTVAIEWNAKRAAERLLVLAERILNGDEMPIPFENGVCSKAEELADNWFKG